MAAPKTPRNGYSERRKDEDVFVENSDYARHHIKKRVIEQKMVPYVCDECGLFAQRAPRKENKKEPSATDVFQCTYCNNSNHISKVMIPYAFKLLIQELIAMNIAPRIRTKKLEF